MCFTLPCQGGHVGIQLFLPRLKLCSCLCDVVGSCGELGHLLIEASDLLVHLTHLCAVNLRTLIEILHLSVDNLHALVECPPTSVMRINASPVSSLSWLESLHLLVEFALEGLCLFR